VSTVLVTGGTGVLGRELVPRVVAAGHTTRIMSRRRGESNSAGDVEWAQADLKTGAGLEQALLRVDTVLHAASSPFKNTHETDVEGTARLLGAAKAAGVSHFYYISIVGIDKMAKFPYYRAKFDAEKVIEESGVPYTILRATQFHPLLDTFLGTLFKRGPFLFLPRGLRFQLIDVGEVAAHMVQTMAAGASGRVPDIGGPKVEALTDLATDWLAATGKKLRRIPVPALGPAGVVASGANLCPDNLFGKKTFQEWLAETYASR
jgi:uncharacterized protein YbjT (DUF2867 family)